MRFPCIASFSILLLLFVCVPAQSQNLGSPRSRAEFIALMAKIKAGTPEKEVLELLGKPDDVRTQFDPGGISRVHTKEIWCYGTRSHLGFPTLGCVYIDKNGKAQESFGGEGQPPKAGLFTEEELRDLLRQLDTAPRMAGYDYNPLPVIQIVNRLQPLGKEKALAAITEYIRISDEWTEYRSARRGMFLVLAVLFDLPKGVYPYEAGAFGAPSPPPPKDPARVPRFPMAVIDDIPLMFVNGYLLAGRASRMEDVAAFYQVHGQLRKSPLVPSNDPLAAFRHLTNSPQWIYGDTNLQQTNGFWPPAEVAREESMIKDQLLRLVDSVCRVPSGIHGDPSLWGLPPEPSWENVVSNVAALKIRWDPGQNDYVLRDRSHLATIQKKFYRRNIWELTGLGYRDAELIIERQNDSSASILVTYTEQKGATLRQATLFIFENGATNSPIDTFSFTNTVGRPLSSTINVGVPLQKDTEVRARLVITGIKTNLSPIFKP